MFFQCIRIINIQPLLYHGSTLVTQKYEHVLKRMEIIIDLNYVDYIWQEKNGIAIFFRGPEEYISHFPFYSKYESHSTFSFNLYESGKGLIFCPRHCIAQVPSPLENCLNLAFTNKEEYPMYINYFLLLIIFPTTD